MCFMSHNTSSLARVRASSTVRAWGREGEREREREGGR